MKIRNLLLLLGTFSVCAYPCRAGITTDSTAVDFGKVYQLSNTGSVILGYSGEPSLSGAAKSSSYTYSAGTAIFGTDNTDSGVTEIITPNTETASGIITGNNCTISVSNVTVSPVSAELTSAVQNANFLVGARLNFSGFCREGTYNGTLSLPYSVNRNGSTAEASTPVTLPVTVQIEEPLSITKSSDIRFGNVTIDPLVGGTVTLSTEGVVSKSEGIISVTGTTSSGQATVSGVGGRTVNISFSSDSATLNGSNGGSLTVNNFVTDPAGSSFVFTGSGAGVEQALKIGATLNVGVAQAKGTYTGNITVTVAY